MSLSVAQPREAAHPLRGLLPLWVGVAIYALFLLAGNRLLIDPDTMWQITVGQWIIDHRAVPATDVYSFTMRGEPWISTQWLAQVMYAKAYSLVRLERAGGAGGRRDSRDLRAAGEIPQPPPERKHDAGVHRRRAGADRAASAGAAACAGAAGHGGLGRRPDRRRGPPRRAVVLAAAADGAVGQSAWRLCLWPGADRRRSRSMRCWARIRAAQKTLLLRWVAFGVAALAASCITPYGWNALLASQKILALGDALPLIMEWKPADFGSLGAFEICLLLGIGLALLRGITLPPMRIVLLLGLLHMAFAQGRAAEILALLAPIILAAPLARQIGGAAPNANAAAPSRGVLFASLALALSRQRWRGHRCIALSRTPAARRSRPSLS